MKDFLLDDFSGSIVHPVRGVALIGDQVTWPMPKPANINHSRSEPAPEMAVGETEPGHIWYRKTGKRVLDVLFVVATAPVSVPIILVCVLALWLEGGLPFYRQDRLGRDGRKFSILKLRTMVRDADEKLEQYLEGDPSLRQEWDTTQKLKNDPRITKFGAFLRATSLDELPQLWNVLIGDMSLVGPRPMLPEQLPLYGNARAYFAMEPGITGIWQVSARNETRFSYRAEVDARYYRELSLRADLHLLLKTTGVVMRRTGY